MNIDGEIISQFVLTFDDAATAVMRRLMLRLEGKIKETGFKRHDFPDDEVELIHEIADMFDPE